MQGLFFFVKDITFLKILLQKEMRKFVCRRGFCIKFFPWESRNGLLLSADEGFYKFFSFFKGETVSFFLCQKEKRTKKEVGKPAV